MGVPVLIIGESGSGKSTSLRNFGVKDVEVLNVASKPLPFKNKLVTINNAGYNTIATELQKKVFTSYVIDDSQYLLCFEMFAKAKDTGYQKFTDMALNFYNMIRFIQTKLPENVIVYMLHHTETDQFGRTKAKTIGKMLDEKLTVEGLFTIVLKAEADGTKYIFRTKTDGNDTVKSPMGMFESAEIDNDLKAVDTIIRQYYEI